MDTLLKRYLLLMLVGAGMGPITCDSVIAEAIAVVVDVIDLKKIQALAELGNSDAQVTLGEMYRDGTQVEKNEARAFELFMKAADKENVAGQLAVAKSYYKGRGVEKDYKKSFYYFEKAAIHGSAEAQHELGCMYRDGVGVVEKSLESSLAWFKKAADSGLDVAKKAWSDVTDAIELKKWQALAALGDPVAQVILGKMYLSGKIVDRDCKKAFELFEKAAARGCSEAQHEIGCMFRDGVGAVERNLDSALEWFKKAAEHGFDASKKALDDLKNAIVSLRP